MGEYRKKRSPHLNDPLQRQGQNIRQKRRAEGSGVGCGFLQESVPKYIKAKGESLIESPRKTARIVLGVDRPGSRMTGYGGRGEQSCGMIDLVAGPLGDVARSNVVSEDQRQRGSYKVEALHADPNPSLDAARVMIVQKSDIDLQYGLEPGWDELTPYIGRSYVLAKADGIRIVSRDAGVKIITGADEKNSQGLKQTSYNGVQLIAGNKNISGTKWEVQSMVKGENLKQLLNSMIDSMNDICNVIDNLIQVQTKWNTAMMYHGHVTTIPGMYTTVPYLNLGDGTKMLVDSMSKTVFPNLKNRFAFTSMKSKYLERADGPQHILSSFNKVN